ncbi:MAG: hypothetical protein JWN36_1673 [Microbacteriaceae bacterium]|nr:hypothetical protein [Microbacteriaceae bacterium]
MLQRTRILLAVPTCAALAAGLGVVATPAMAATTTPILTLNTPFTAENDFANQFFLDGSRSQLVIATLSGGIEVAGTDASGKAVNVYVHPGDGQPLAAGHFDIRFLPNGTVDRTKDTVDIGVAGEGGNFTGSLDILDLAWDASGHITRFDISMQGLGELRYGESEPTAVNVASTHMGFPEHAVSSAPDYEKESLHNTGGSSVAIGALSTSGYAESDYSVANDTCGGRSLAAGATCSFEVGFSPRAGGPRTASLIIPIGSISQLVGLVGSGSIGTSSLSFSGSDSVSNGHSYTFTAGSKYGIAEQYGPTGYSWIVGEPTAGNPIDATANFNRPGGGPLEVGHHLTDQGGTGDPLYGQSVSVNGMGCTTAGGNEDVDAFTADSFGYATLAKIRFTQYCSGDTAHPMTGTFLWNYRSDTTAPNAPTGLTVGSGAGATARWTASSSSDATHTIARLVAGDGSGATPLSGYALSGGTSTSVALPSVGAGAYTVAVFAVDATGNASAPALAHVTIGATTPVVVIPSAPQNVVATAGNGSVSVAFTAPASTGGSPITGYQLKSDNTGAVVTGATSPLTITGLRNGFTYQFTLQAISAAGLGTPAAPILASPTAGATPPPPPPATGQLLPDPGFEAGNGGWVAFTAGTLARVTSPVRGGADSLRVAAVSATPGLVGLTQNSAVTSTVAGKTYTFSCWVQPTSGSLSVQARLLEYTQNFGSNIHVGTSATTTVGAGAWTLVTVSGVAAKAGERMVPQIYSTTETTSTGSMLYDDCSLTAP